MRQQGLSADTKARIALCIAGAVFSAASGSLATYFASQRALSQEIADIKLELGQVSTKVDMMLGAARLKFVPDSSSAAVNHREQYQLARSPE